MRLAGLQKLTLLDFPGVVSCTVFTSGCNFNCPFCHNALLVKSSCDSPLLENELLSFLEQRKGILEGVVITGGEPLLNQDIGQLLKKIKNLGYKVKLDTNGTNPTLLKSLVAEKLIDYVAMDIKDSPAGYPKAIGTGNFNLSAVCESKDFLLENKVDYEFRTTVVKGIHSKESLIDLAKWISGANKYYLQQFKDSGNLICGEGLSAFSPDELRIFSKEITPYVKKINIRGI